MEIYPYIYTPNSRVICCIRSYELLVASMLDVNTFYILFSYSSRHIHKSRGHTPYTPVLTQLADALFNPAHPELSDVDFHSQGSMSNIIKSSFRYV